MVQPDRQVYQSIQAKCSIPTGQLPTDVLSQATPLMVYQGPVVPPCSLGQGPELQREVLRAPRPLSKMEQSLTRRSTLWRVIEHGPETAGELRVIALR